VRYQYVFCSQGSSPAFFQAASAFADAAHTRDVLEDVLRVAKPRVEMPKPVNGLVAAATDRQS